MIIHYFIICYNGILSYAFQVVIFSNALTEAMLVSKTPATIIIILKFWNAYLSFFYCFSREAASQNFDLNLKKINRIFEMGVAT